MAKKKNVPREMTEEERKEWEEELAERKIDRKAFKIVSTMVFTAIFLAIGIIAGLVLYVSSGLRPAYALNGEVRVTVEKGMHPSKIAELLEEKGLIRDHFIFKYYLRLKDEGSRFQAGTYDFVAENGVDEIIRKLNNGEIIPEEQMRFTIPEGYTIQQMADRLQLQGMANSEKFVEVSNYASGLKSAWVKEIPENTDIKYRLEGYVFPETYQVRRDSNETELINRMLQELDNKLVTLPEDWQGQLDLLGLSFHEMLTVASIIEREAVVNEERPMVASVIYNRLAQGMMLQIDATVQYALGEQQEIVTYDHLEIDSPYNTYKITGLPPGPIASPGIASIRAALYPEESEYLFYVTKKDGSQGHYFGKTYEEHQQNIRKSNEEAGNKQ